MPLPLDRKDEAEGDIRKCAECTVEEEVKCCRSEADEKGDPMNGSDRGCDEADRINQRDATTFEFEAECPWYLIGDDEECGCGDVAGGDGAGDVLDKVGYLKVGAEKDEETDEEEEKGNSCEHTISSQSESGESAEQNDGGGIGGAEGDESGIGKNWTNYGGDGRSVDAILNRESGNECIGHALGEGEEGNVDTGAQISGQVAFTVLSNRLRERKPLQ